MLLRRQRLPAAVPKAAAEEAAAGGCCPNSARGSIATAFSSQRLDDCAIHDWRARVGVRLVLLMRVQARGIVGVNGDDANTTHLLL